MKLSNMFKKTSRRGYISLGEGKPAHMAPEVPEGLLKKCNVCKSAILTEDDIIFVQNVRIISVCMRCTGLKW